MSEKNMVILDGNEAAASVAYRLTEVVAIYPITPSSPMAEWADQWRSEGKKNIWGALPIVEELQSEGGAAGGKSAAPLSLISGGQTRCDAKHITGVKSHIVRLSLIMDASPLGSGGKHELD